MSGGERHAGGIANAPGGTQAQMIGHGVMWLLRKVVVYHSYADGCRERECCCCDGIFDGKNESEAL